MIVKLYNSMLLKVLDKNFEKFLGKPVQMMFCLFRVCLLITKMRTKIKKIFLLKMNYIF